MITISNNKVAGFNPRWAQFPGFSLLFDNPGQGFTLMAPDLLKLDCPVAQSSRDDGLVLYRSLTQALRQFNLDRLVNNYLFCPLPPYSYHVTVWDGLNTDNRGSVLSPHQEQITQFLENMPDSFSADALFSPIINESELVNGRDLTISYQFDHLYKWGNIGLVCALTPASDTDRQTHEHITTLRHRLYEKFGTQFGGVNEWPFTPHISLGYFANAELAEQTTPHVEDWHEIVQQKAAGQTITFNNISLYGFTDMATFFKTRKT